ncbi:hypothetical protein E4U12_000765 [Claviceps purpurea]|nr:hypothetical protein E4U12_000765 [Claviceps purpurea]
MIVVGVYEGGDEIESPASRANRPYTVRAHSELTDHFRNFSACYEPGAFSIAPFFFLLFYTADEIFTMARKKKKRKKGRDATSAWPKGRPTIGDDPLLIKRRVDLRRRKVIGMRDLRGGQHHRPYPNRNYMSLKKSEIWVRDLCTVVRQNATVASTKDLGRIQNLSIPNQNMS